MFYLKDKVLKNSPD